MRSITAVPCECARCQWDGVTGDCEANDSGDLCCPICLNPVVIDCSEQEMQPPQHSESQS
jgi:hypothetical protein